MSISDTFVQRIILSRIKTSKEDVSQVPTKLQIALWSLVVGLFLIISLRGFDLYQIGTHYDDARYIILTQSLLNADDYGTIHMPGPVGVAFYPFGYPLLLAPFALLSSGDYSSLKLLSLTATLLSASLLFWGWPYLSRRSYWWALGISSLYCLAPVTIDLSRRVMSEPVFLFFTLSALILVERAVRGQQGPWWYFWLGLSLVFVLFTRTIGIVFVGSIFLYLLYAKRLKAIKDIALTMASMTLITTIIVSVTVIQPADLWPSRYFKGDYASFLVGIGSALSLIEAEEALSERYLEDEGSDEFGRTRFDILVNDFLILGSHIHITEHYRRAIVPIGGDEFSVEQRLANRLGVPHLPIVIGYTIFAILLVGLCRWLILEGVSAFLLYAILYMAALTIWSWNDVRLLYPIYSQLHLGFFLGVEALLIGMTSLQVGSKAEIRKLQWVLPICIVGFFLISTVKSLRIPDSRHHVGDLQTRSQWLAEHAEPDAVFVSEAPAVDFIYSQRKGLEFPWSEGLNSTELHRFLHENAVDYLLVSPQISWQPQFVPKYSNRMAQLLPVINELEVAEQLTSVYSSEENLIHVYKFQDQ